MLSGKSEVRERKVLYEHSAEGVGQVSGEWKTPRVISSSGLAHGAGLWCRLERIEVPMRGFEAPCFKGTSWERGRAHPGPARVVL